MDNDDNNHIIVGVVTSRKCPACGHHEVGYETDSGDFFPLRPGDRVGILQEPHTPQRFKDTQEFMAMPSRGDKNDSSGFEPWAPDSLRSDRSLRSKYAVLVDRDMVKGGMSAALYEMAYRHKLQELIQREVFTPISVILDRYFVAPHLAAGDSKQVADALWKELEEIRTPVMLVSRWLENPDDENFSRMIHPLSADDLKNKGVSDEQLKQELAELSLEDFFELL